MTIAQAQAEDAKMIAELDQRNNSDADWRSGIIRQKMMRRQSFAFNRNISISPQICGCGNIVAELVSIYWMCEKCITEYDANQETSIT